MTTPGAWGSSLSDSQTINEGNSGSSFSLCHSTSPAVAVESGSSGVLKEMTSYPSTVATTSSFVAPVTPENTHRGIRSHYFVPGDIVWVRPARLPYWPAEVIEIHESLNIVRARLFDPPIASLLKANEALERQQVIRIQAKQEKSAIKRQRKEGSVTLHSCTHTETDEVGVKAKDKDVLHTCCGEDRKTSSLLAPITNSSDVVTTSGIRVYFFDKLTTPEEIEACVEQRLRRSSYDVSQYEGCFYKAVLHANRLVRIVLCPELLQPYQICGIGVVYSLMRSHTSAPRQPHTGKVIPQPGVIRLRKGFENAARDLMGFDYIWVLFQFSYAAAIATSVGQKYVLESREEEKARTRHGKEGVDDAPKGKKGRKKKPLLKDMKSSLAGIEKNNAESGEGNGPPACYSSAPSSNPLSFGKKIDAKHAAEEGATAGPSSSSSFTESQRTPAETAISEVCGDLLRNWRHRQGLPNARGFKTMIIPPRDTTLRGVFATRSPHRPNFIGMSAVRLVSVQGLDIHIIDHDLLHGTPVLDIKPYLPFCDAHPEAKSGWVEELDASGNGRGDHKYETQEMFVHRIFERQEEERNSLLEREKN